MKTLKTLLPGFLMSVVVALPSIAKAESQTVEQDVAAMAGQWQGESHDGSKVTFTIAVGQDDLVGKGSIKIEGGVFAGESEYTLLRDDNVYFMVPDQSPFAAGKEAYTMNRLPGGGLKFVRLAHIASEGPAAVQAEEIEIGRQSHQGTRSIKLVRGKRLCLDPAAPAGRPCGNAVSEQIVLSKAP